MEKSLPKSWTKFRYDTINDVWDEWCLDDLRKVIDGECTEPLDYAFCWSDSPYPSENTIDNYSYWSDKCFEDVPLSPSDIQFLKFMISGHFTSPELQIPDGGDWE